MVAAVVKRVVSGALELLPERQRRYAYKQIRRLRPWQREILAARYLRGSGIEVGAMHNPLAVPRGVSVRYVDYVSREENLERFTEIEGGAVVPDFIEDGFALPSFAPSSVDFLVANHVLEHTDNVLKTLVRWGEVLRPSGVLLMSVPLAERCFDRGRPITPLAHFIDDHHSERSDPERFRQQTREHYAEWLSISLPAVVAEHGDRLGKKNSEDIRKTVDELLAEHAEIHFHTFSTASYRELLQHFCTEFRPDFQIAEVVEDGIEVVGILKRN